MNGIKLAPMNQPCDLVDLSGNLSLNKLTSLGEKDCSAAVDIIKSISLDGNLARVIQDATKDVVKDTIKNQSNI